MGGSGEDLFGGVFFICFGLIAMFGRRAIARERQRWLEKYLGIEWSEQRLRLEEILWCIFGVLPLGLGLVLLFGYFGGKG